MNYIIALDQGTTSCRSLLVDKSGKIQGMEQLEFPQIYPAPQWVEHDPQIIWNCQLNTMKRLVQKMELAPNQIKGIGITNQRETTVVWDRNTGKPVYNAIVWQCRRTASFCNELKKEKGIEKLFKTKTGLPVDAYFSGTKIRWILDHVEGARARAERGDLLFGTMDSWLIWKLTGGRVHITDMTNACRTLLFNIHTLDWDKELLSLLNIPPAMLPRVKSCSEVYAYTDRELMGEALPIAGIAGDQQAALFGQMCLDKGDVKNTYGTGCFLLMNTGEKPVFSPNGLLTTLALNIGGRTSYALEGSIFMGGAVIQWLRDNLGLIASAPECDHLAENCEDNGGVYLVSAFQGLGTPYWDMEARAAISGLTRAADKRHICRGALESIAYRSREVMDIMARDSGISLKAVKVDGGASRSNILMQFQSDISACQIIRPESIETTALGAAYLAGLATGFWTSIQDIRQMWKEDKSYIPRMNESQRDKLYKGWKKAVARCLTSRESFRDGVDGTGTR